jgi:hypothetical protein
MCCSSMDLPNHIINSDWLIFIFDFLNNTSLESSDPFHRALSLVNPITDVPLQRSVRVRVAEVEVSTQMLGSG